MPPSLQAAGVEKAQKQVDVPLNAQAGSEKVWTDGAPSIRFTDTMHVPAQDSLAGRLDQGDALLRQLVS
eukprot:8591646-Prorocentrum_lima.AAC.1